MIIGIMMILIAKRRVLFSLIIKTGLTSNPQLGLILELIIVNTVRLVSEGSDQEYSYFDDFSIISHVFAQFVNY